MLTIMHGEDTAASRKSFSEYKLKHPDAKSLDGEKMSLIDLAQIFEGGELFSNSKTVFIEHFLSRKKKSAEKEALIAYLQKNAEENEIILWEGKELDRSVLNNFKTAVIKAFKLPQMLFLFVENLKPGNGPQLISLFQKTIASTEPEMVFFMLIRQVRLMLALTSAVIPAKAGIQRDMDPRVKPEDDNNPIDEIKRMAPWQISKLQQQAKMFQPDQLLTLYRNLFQIEQAQKTGTLSSSLAFSIDFLLLEI